MKKIIISLFFISIILIGYSASGQTKILNGEAKMRESSGSLSKVIFTLPANTQVQVKADPNNEGYYKVEYKGKIGYINELFFQKAMAPTLPNNNSDIKYSPVTKKPTFQNMLSGVKYAVIINEPEIVGHIPAFNALFDYLQTMGFESVEYMNDNYEAPDNLCDEIWTYITFDYRSGNFGNIKWRFVSPCNEDYEWELSSKKNVMSSVYGNTESNLKKVLREMHPYIKPKFNPSHRITLPERQTYWTELKLKNHIITNGYDKIEGIYENSERASYGAKYKVAVRKIKTDYHLIYLTGASNPGNWKEGEIKATLEPTANPLLYKAKWIMADKSVNDDYYINFENGIMNVLDHDNDKDVYIKLFPPASDEIRNSPSVISSSGTGWAISSNGYIVTNHHVVENAQSLKVRGINGDFSRTYSAKIVIEDKTNDLAIIKVDDIGFTSLGTIPYAISLKGSEVGSSIFVLGYPLRATMGDEVKLTNGIISSKSGYQGDVSSYQITAPIQPGNSGGPLFDNKGNVIGIINAKHAIAENASYAIKASYLTNLIELISEPIKLQSVTSVSGKSLTEQVKVLREFTYIIEAN